MLPSTSSNSLSSAVSPSSRLTLHHPALPNGALPGNLTLGQLLNILQDHEISLSTPCVTLNVKQISSTTGSTGNPNSNKGKTVIINSKYSM